MQIVIDIPEDLYEECTRLGDSSDILFEAIRKGKILPKGHGDLIDINEITAFRELECNGHDVESLDEFTVTIEADKCTYVETGCGSCRRQLDCPVEAESEVTK